MFRKEILDIFFEHLKIDECGRYLIELGPERCYLEVEDTAFVVMAVYKTHNAKNGREQLEILLNDEYAEILDANSLHRGNDNVLYCRVKQGLFDARFTRKSYYQLAEFIEQSDNSDSFFISLNGDKYFIKDSQAS